MGFNIQSLVSSASDYARDYLFYAQVSKSPVGLEFSSTHKYMVSSTTLPSQTVEPITTNWQGMEYSIGGTTSFEDFTISFKCDPAQATRGMFLQWMNMIHDPSTNIHGLPVMYFGTIGLSQLNGFGIPTVRYDLQHAWPTVVGEVSLDYSSKDISKFDVTFKYLYHTISDVGLAGSATIGAIMPA